MSDNPIRMRAHLNADGQADPTTPGQNLSFDDPTTEAYWVGYSDAIAKNSGGPMPTANQPGTTSAAGADNTGTATGTTSAAAADNTSAAPEVPTNTGTTSTAGADAAPTATGTTGSESSANNTLGDRPTGDLAEPAVDVPEDAFRVTEDMAVSDNMVAIAPDGTVIDSRGAGTVIHTSDGIQVTIGADGKVSVDGNFRNASTADQAVVEGDQVFESDGTTVLTDQHGNVVITQGNGQQITVYPNGTFDIDLPDASDDGSTPDDGVVPPPGGETDEDEDGEDGEDGDGRDDEGDDAEDGSGEEPPTDAPTPPTNPPGNPPTNPPGNPPTSPPGNPPTNPPTDDPPQRPTDPPQRPTDPPPTDEPEVDPPPTDTGEDIEVDPADLDEDGEYYADRAADARVLSECFVSLKSAIVDWGLWGRAQGPFNTACDKMAQHLDSGRQELTDMSTGLHRSAAEYRNNEQSGEELANKIF